MSEKRPMKMKRVDVEDTGGVKEVQGEDPIVQMAEDAREGVKPVRSFNGVAVVGSDDDIAAMETTVSEGNKQQEEVVQKVGAMSKDEDGVVTVNTDDDDDEMEEVSYEDWASSQKSVLADGEDVKAQVENLVSLDQTEAEKVLSDLEKNGKITSYRIMPMGAPFTFDVSPGRVQVLLDATKKVIQTQIG